MINEIWGERFDKPELLEKVDGDNEIVELLIESAKLQISQYIGDIQTHFDSFGGDFPSDCEKIKQCAHAIKGSAFNLSFHRLGNVAKALEFSIKEHESNNISTEEAMSDCRELIKLLDSEWTALLTLLK
jgi:HPt (histidine-containing phosphotransfer) domain-containing protein